MYSMYVVCAKKPGQQRLLSGAAAAEAELYKKKKPVPTLCVVTTVSLDRPESAAVQDF